jgi:hypothetical protein
MEKEVSLEGLLASEVFCYTFDFDSWPSAHAERDKYIRPYNGSIFSIRDEYRNIFFEDKFEVPDENRATEQDSSKIFKISYEVNILSYINEYMEYNEIALVDPKGKHKKHKFFNKHISLMNKCVESPELNIFYTESIQDIIDFKW